jgi:dTDP-4-dehydrorhamnose reductase
MNKLLITGGSGFVGKNLAEFFSKRFSVATTYFQHPIAVGKPASESFQLDIRDHDAVFSLFERVEPSVVIHAAGNKNVRFGEENPEEAHRINALGTQNIARACRRLAARLVYVSTDLVFECVRGNYDEDEKPEPTLVYGSSKLLGEKLANEELTDVAICRSGGVYGKESPLLGWFSAEVSAGRSVECPVDVFNTPTYAENLAEMIEVIINKRLAGIFHTVGRERVSRFDFFRSYTTQFGLDSNLVTPVSLADMKDSSMLRPDSSLSSKRTAGLLGIDFNSVEEGFVRLRADRG